LLGLSGAAATLPFSGFSSDAPAASHLNLGLASYTLRSFKLGDAIKMMLRVGLKNVALKSMHMPLDGSADQVKEAAAKVRAAGLNLYGAGVIYMKTSQEADTAFAYANNAGLQMIIGSPNPELLPQISDLVKKYNIKLAIHNHGPGDNNWSSPNDVYEKIKSMDKRIGLCIDIGHTTRIGQDPSALLEKYADRLYDMHMKDESKAVPEGDTVEIGRGVIDIPKVVATLKKINYQGTVAFEYEKDSDDPLPGLAESVGYVKGVMKMQGID
jgi:sugar phosphate isomerase/epimerase